MGCFYNDKICFIHIPKCGGTSITNAARSNLPGFKEPGVKRKDHKQGLPIGHITASDFENFLGISLDSFEFVFATIRDPIDCEWSKWNFWRGRFYKDWQNIEWRHPADQWCWDRTFEQYIEERIEPFNEWYCQSVSRWATPNYNEVGRFDWWLSPKVKAIDLLNTKKINEILSDYCGKKIKIGQENKTGSKAHNCSQEIKKIILETYSGKLAIPAIQQTRN